MNWLERFRDWCRGYSDADLTNVRSKLEYAEHNPTPGDIVYFNPAEMRAYWDNRKALS